MSAANFEPIMLLLTESSANGILVKVLAKWWLDTTHMFYIVRRELAVTPHDFHWMIGLRADMSIINLECELGIQLGVDLLGHMHSSEHTTTLTWKGTIDLVLRRRLMIVPGCPRNSCCTYWGHICLPIEGRRCL